MKPEVLAKKISHLVDNGATGIQILPLLQQLHETSYSEGLKKGKEAGIGIFEKFGRQRS